MAAHAREHNIYAPGDLAPVSGLYRVEHLTGHREPHTAVIIRGEELPMCRTCKTEVRFLVMHSASHVTHDWDFAAPTGLVVRQNTTEHADLRAFPRQAVELQVEVEAEKGGSLRGQTANVSEGGICALLDQKLGAENALVSVRIDVPGVAGPATIGALLRYRAGHRHGFFFTDGDGNAREIVREIMSSVRRKK